jgi:hypothetical protein
MEEAKKSFYTIPEAAKLKGVTEEELCRGIREGKIQTKQIGMRQMIPADIILNDVVKDENLAKRYLEQIREDLLSLLDKAPKYGSCGILITFHGGKIMKVSKQSEVTRIEGKDDGKKTT